MSELQDLVVRTYEQGKSGQWGRILAEWKKMPVLARRCSRYRKKSSGWSFLHQAAYFGNEKSCRELIRLGSWVGAKSLEGKTAADISSERGHVELAVLLTRALQERESLWAPSDDPDLLPSSNLWDEATEYRAEEYMLIGYAGSIVKIPTGESYYVDSFGRILVGWHGTYNPPCGMDGEPML